MTHRKALCFSPGSRNLHPGHPAQGERVPLRGQLRAQEGRQVPRRGDLRRRPRPEVALRGQYRILNSPDRFLAQLLL